MKKYFTAAALLSTLLIAPLPQAFAQDSTAAATKPATAKTTKSTKTADKTADKTAAKKPARKSHKKVKEDHPKAVAETTSGHKIALSEDSEDETSEPETAGTKVYEFNCELGNKITAYKNEGDEKFLAIRWNKHILRLHRVATTTGANRFENRQAGLVWIGIPAKSMLLDSKKGQQLANECKLVEPVASAVTVAPQAGSNS